MPTTTVTSFRIVGSIPCCSARGPSACPHREREREGGAAADLALHPDLAAMEFDELPGERQTQPGAFRFPLRGAHLPELLEDRLLIRRRDADARIRDGHLHHLAVQPASDVDPPPSGVNFRALERRFKRTCFTFRSSPRIVPRCSSTVRPTVMPRRVARSRTKVSALS